MAVDQLQVGEPIRSTAEEVPSGEQPSPALGQSMVTIDELVAAHHRTVYRYAYWLSGCPATAEDVTQETFLKAMRGLAGLLDPGAAQGWLLRIARNEFLRMKQRQQRLLAGVDTSEVQSREQDIAGQLEERDWVHAALAELSEEFRTAILMFYFEELSYAEIARELQVPIGTVMSRLNRAKAHLKRKFLHRHGDDPTPTALHADRPSGEHADEVR
ncbi:MAG: RNA polymerase sigma factor SigE [Pirellulaceae bacterium]|nr:MAG: RNA polymerase sigma factor SigE [Pirellulaceae bacterium]